METKLIAQKLQEIIEILNPDIPEVPEPWAVKIPESYKNIGKVSVRNGFISFSLTEFFNLDRKLDFDLYIKESEK